MIFLDCETVGLCGIPVTIQYAGISGAVRIHEIWREPVRSTLRLIEGFCHETVVAFNLSFDWFHLQKVYSILSMVENKSEWPRLKEVVALERRASREGPCIKPRSALDLYLYALKGPFQSLMDRDDVRVRRVPAALCEPLAEELTRRLDVPEIYFLRRRGGGQWQVQEDPDDPMFPDVVLRFGASSRLKAIVGHVLGLDTMDLPVPKEMRPSEDEWKPFDDGREDGWPTKLSDQVWFWHENEEARTYARRDVEYLQKLYEHWGRPAHGDDDSVLAASVASVRWRGFRVDVPRCRDLLEKVNKLSTSAPTAPNAVLKHLAAVMDETEQLCLVNTRKETLKGIETWGDHLAAERARAVRIARESTKRAENLVKLIDAEGMFPDFRVLGTLSGRMSGRGRFSAHGIPKKKEFRACLPLAWEDETLSGGDFSGFEVTLADAVYDDPKLRAALREGKKIHALFGAGAYKIEDVDLKVRSPASCMAEAIKVREQLGQFVEPDDERNRYLTYDEVRGTDGEEQDFYGPSKNSFFASLFGAMGKKIAETLRIAPTRGDEVLANFDKEFPGVGKARAEIQMAFTALMQPGGIGTEVVWRKPDDYVESIFGFKRYFTLENALIKCIFQLAQKPPRRLHEARIKVRRRDRVQTAGGATRSALYAAAFQIMARNQRAAGNHVIQSPGAQITKRLQRRIWDLQPYGVHPYLVRPMNVHDEVMVPNRGWGSMIRVVVDEVVEEFREKVPLLAIDWHDDMATWAEK